MPPAADRVSPRLITNMPFIICHETERSRYLYQAYAVQRQNAAVIPPGHLSSLMPAPPVATPRLHRSPPSRCANQRCRQFVDCQPAPQRSHRHQPESHMPPRRFTSRALPRTHQRPREGPSQTTANRSATHVQRYHAAKRSTPFVTAHVVRRPTPVQRRAVQMRQHLSRRGRQAQARAPA